MLIVDFSQLDSVHEEYIPQFLDLLVRTIRSEVMSNLNLIYLNSKSTHLCNAVWMRWYHKPKRINMMKLVKLILDNLRWTKLNSSMYKIYVDPRATLPHSSNSLDQVARWIEFGDQNVCRPMFFISHAESLIKPLINKYWKSFIQSKEGVLQIHECIHVR